jgi:hypothetical protein
MDFMASLFGDDVVSARADGVARAVAIHGKARALGGNLHLDGHSHGASGLSRSKLLADQFV